MVERTVILENIQAFGFVNALRGMRNPLQSWDKNDTYEYLQLDESLVNTDCNNKIIISENTPIIPVIGPNDLELSMKLATAGGPHAKFRRQIHVSYDLTAPWLFWKEYETYQVGTVENSTSQMFTMGNRLLKKEDFSFTTWGRDEEYRLNFLNRLVDEWQRSDRKKRSPEWRKLIEHIPGSFLYKRTCTLNYEVLSNMYKFRKKHKLQEWRDMLEILVEELPYSQLFTLEIE